MITVILALIIIYINATVISIFFNKKIDETIIITVVFLVLIEYLCGLIGNLQLGIKVIEIITIASFLCIVYAFIKSKEKLKILKNIFTPGLMVYIIFILISICINKNRIFEKFDEYNHWAVMTKNMFAFNNFGTGHDIVLRYSEYPPFTNIVQYLFLGVLNIFREDVAIVAQSILYFSIIISIFRKIEWNRSLIYAIILAPIMFFIPTIFYANFYHEILVDGLLGVMFAYIVYQFINEEDNLSFKYMKIFIGMTMLALTKTSGIALLVFLVIAYLINIFKNKKSSKEKRTFLILICIVLLLTSLWYMQTNGQNKHWEWSNYLDITRYMNTESIDIANAIVRSIFIVKYESLRKIPIFYYIITIILIDIVILIYCKKTKAREYKNYKYYTVMMLIEIPIFILALYVSYITIFSKEEASSVSSFGRYISTLLLANIIIPIMYIIEIKDGKLKRVFFASLLIATICLIPYNNMKQSNFYNTTCKTEYDKKMAERNSAMKVSRYTSVLNSNDKIMYLTSEPKRIETRIRIIKYELIPITIDKVTLEEIETLQEFENTVSKYNYLYINKLNKQDQELIKTKFEDNNIKPETLYYIGENNMFIEKSIK